LTWIWTRFSLLSLKMKPSPKNIFETRGGS
jgi:hypothetical protein